MSLSLDKKTQAELSGLMNQVLNTAFDRIGKLVRTDMPDAVEDVSEVMYLLFGLSKKEEFSLSQEKLGKRVKNILSLTLKKTEEALKREDAEAARQVLSAMGEVFSIARKGGIAFDRESLQKSVEKVLNTGIKISNRLLKLKEDEKVKELVEQLQVLVMLVINAGMALAESISQKIDALAVTTGARKALSVGKEREAAQLSLVKSQALSFIPKSTREKAAGGKTR